ncbi:MAG: hypothetical protein ACI8UO_005412 [Verrucomicrobiales bacterium]|jgi:hypothetical protein
MTPPIDVEKAHKWFAIECNNQAWDLLESTERTSKENERLIHTAHASCFHWLNAGKAIHHARAESLVANAHSAAGSGESALRHAKRCLELIEAKPEGVADWDLAFALDGLARASAAAGDETAAAENRKKAREAGDAIADAEDRKFFDAWFEKES